MPASPVEPARLAPTRPRAALFLLALFTFCFSAYVFTSSADYFSTGDTTIRIEIAENILGRFSVDLHGWKLQYAKHIKKEYLDPRIDTGRGGKVYSTYELGQPLFIIPFDLAAQRIAVHMRWPFGPTVLWIDRLVGPLMGALEVTVFFLFAFALGYGRRRALLLTLLFAFATSAWPDAESVLEHTEVTVFLLLAFYGAFRYREQRAGPFYLVLAGAGIGGAASTRYQDALLGAVALGIYLLLPGGRSERLLDRIRDLVLVCVGVVPFAILDAWYSWYRFGSPLASGHHETVFGYAIWKGVAGLLISPGKGLLWYCPPIALLVFVAPRFYRRYSALAISFTLLVVTFFLLYGYVTYWHGDPAWGPRYVYSTVPFMILPLGELFMPGLRRARAIWLVAAAILL
ncbi:MAG TPA: glycosyltransferase family 39 protein, partial [Chloroflexota bacterium]